MKLNKKLNKNRALIVKPKMPLNFEESPIFFKDGLDYPLYPSKFKIYYLNLILPGGEFYSFLKFNKDSAAGIIFSPKFSLKYLFSKIKTNEVYFNYKNNTLHFYDSWTSNHFHFMVDFLPRLLLLEKEELSKLTLLLPDTKYIKNVGLKLIDFF